VRIWANIDDGAMREVMSTTTFEKVKHRLGAFKPSSQLLRVANRTIVQSEAKWRGKIEINGVSAEVTFEVFDSGGKWDFLLGKTLLKTFRAIHDYEADRITLRGIGGTITIQNQAQTRRRIHNQSQLETPICVITEDNRTEGEGEPAEVEVEIPQGDKNLFTRMTEPNKPERIQELLRLMTIGEDLSTEERQKVEELVCSFADIFALSVSKVKVVENAVHRLDIPSDASFSMKVHQKPLTPPQHRYLHTSIDAMLEAGVIEACKPEDVKCISSTTLAQKPTKAKDTHWQNYNIESTMTRQ
jgi:hypothetical protein